MYVCWEAEWGEAEMPVIENFLLAGPSITLSLEPREKHSSASLIVSHIPGCKHPENLLAHDFIGKHCP